MGIKEDAYRYAVKNAFAHQGKADLGALIGKLKALHKDTPVPELMPIVTETVKKVNSLPFSEIEKEFKKFEEGYELKPKPEREGLPELEWAEKGGKVVTRYAPNPNGPFHLGNARAAYLSFAYAEKYNGNFFLRFEDTDPKVKKPMHNPEAIFREDLKWLGIEPEKVFFASDRLEIYYNYMRKLLEMDKAYVCHCESESWRKLIQEKKACPCRERKKEEQLADFEKMLAHTLKEGAAVLRIKTDLKNPDPSVRDWWIARIVDRPSHPRVGDKYHLWPSFMFQSAIDDYEMGVTFILRGQEHSQNSTKQKYLYDYFEWRLPKAVHFGRLKIGSMVLSTSKIKEGIEKGIYNGWDDIRLGTIKALRRRGFRAEALKKIIADSGLTTSDASISTQKLASYNKELIIGESERTTYITDPIKLEVQMHEEIEIEKEGKLVSLPRGYHEFIVSKKDSEKNDLRLRELYNIKVESRDEFSCKARFSGNEAKGKTVIGWINEPMDLELVLSDGSKEVGMIESKQLEKGKRLYLEKKGYCIIDSVEGKRPVAWFTHE